MLALVLDSYRNRAFEVIAVLREVPCRGPGSFVLRDYNHSSEGLLVVNFGPGTYITSHFRQVIVHIERRFNLWDNFAS